MPVAVPFERTSGLKSSAPNQMRLAAPIGFTQAQRRLPVSKRPLPAVRASGLSLRPRPSSCPRVSRRRPELVITEHRRACDGRLPWPSSGAQVITEHRRGPHGRLPGAGELAGGFRKAAVPSGESCRVAECFRATTRTTFRGAASLRRAHANPPPDHEPRLRSTVPITAVTAANDFPLFSTSHRLPRGVSRLTDAMVRRGPLANARKTLVRTRDTQ